MTERISIGQLYPHAAVPPGVAKRNPAINGEVPQKSFKDILHGNMVHFSHHAELRLQQRGIQLQSDQLTKLESAIDQAAAKGAKDSLILINDMALIVNIKNRTVITAMDGSSIKDNVFTKIDSAVIVS